jgi:multidrug efflux pump subunit AcrA (membrane-fusion protein)
MALFKINPETTLQRDIDAARTNLSRLTAKRAETEQAIIERKGAAQALARDGADDEVLGKAEAATRSAQDRATTIADAVVEVEQQLARLERERDDLADKKLRAETVAEVAQMAIDLEKIAQEIDPFLEKMIGITGRATEMQIWNAHGLGNFATASKVQIPAAIDLVVASLHEHTTRVLNGLSPASLPKQDAPVAIVAAPAEPPKDHFTYSTSKPGGPSYRVPGGFSKEKW